MSYLIHFNKNHSPKNGQFVSGDGDGDGSTNDRNSDANKKKKAKPVEYMRSLKEAFIQGMLEQQAIEEHNRFQREADAQAQQFVNQHIQEHQRMVNQEFIDSGHRFTQQQLDFNTHQAMEQQQLMNLNMQQQLHQQMFF